MSPEQITEQRTRMENPLPHLSLSNRNYMKTLDTHVRFFCSIHFHRIFQEGKHLSNLNHGCVHIRIVS